VAGGIQQRVPASVEQIGQLRSTVLAFAAQSLPRSDRLTEAIWVGVTEACSNVVKHAYPDSSAGPLTLTAWVENQQLNVQVADEGVGIKTASANSGLGLGIPLMDEFAAAEFTENGGTTVHLRFPTNRVAPTE
jgi:serine/threonine-protein kinase RsbW